MPFGGDEAEYHELAVRLLAGEGFTLSQGTPTAWRTPGFPLMLAGIYGIVGENPMRARKTLVILTSLTAPLLFGLTLVLFGSMSTAVLAGLYWAALPTSVRLSGLLLGESSAALVFTLALFILVLAERQRPWVIWLVGVLLGFVILVRGYMIPAVAVPIVWLMVRRQWRPAAAIALSVALVLGVWATRNAFTMGVFTISTEAEVLWLGNNQWARGTYYGNWEPQLDYLESRHPGFRSFDEVARASVFRAEGVREIVENPGRFVWLMPRKAAIFLSPSHPWLGLDLLYLALLPLCLVGGYTLWTAGDQRLILLGLPVLSVTVLCIVTFGDSRFRHPVEPLMAVLGACGVTTVMARLPHRNGERASATLREA